MKIDPYKSEERFRRWKEKTKDGIPGVSGATSSSIKAFIRDMELGLNVSPSSKKGPRSFIRINNLAIRLTFIAKSLERRFGLKCLIDVTESQISEFFAEMRNGILTRRDGGKYRSVAYYAEVFKSFWHWHVLVERRQGRVIADITEYLDSRPEKTEWVYLTEEQVKALCNNATFRYKALILFLYDSGIRSPTELVNVRVCDLSDGFAKLNIRDEASKTFGRKINLMLCASVLTDYVKQEGLSVQDQLFRISAPVVNRYLKRLSQRVLGGGVSAAGGKWSDLTLYDFRHSSACYWIQRYKSESALKYRFGWKESEMIYYYTDFLGLRDNINQEDMLVDVTKTEIEQKLAKAESDKRRMEDEMDSLRRQMKEILELTKGIVSKAA